MSLHQAQMNRARPRTRPCGQMTAGPDCRVEELQRHIHALEVQVADLDEQRRALAAEVARLKQVG